jgi:hypothetical protein
LKKAIVNTHQTLSIVPHTIEENVIKLETCITKEKIDLIGKIGDLENRINNELLNFKTRIETIYTELCSRATSASSKARETSN